eukprot:m.1003200 g.1003200  ORF g.1003200 m.1003200 type:complete len:882 (+) comp24042_c0_seq2:250-2895(+)
MDLSQSLDDDIAALQRISVDTDASDGGSDDEINPTAARNHEMFAQEDNCESEAPVAPHASWDDEIAALRGVQDDSSDEESNLDDPSGGKNITSSSSNGNDVSKSLATTQDGVSWDKPNDPPSLPENGDGSNTPKWNNQDGRSQRKGQSEAKRPGETVCSGAEESLFNETQDGQHLFATSLPQIPKSYNTPIEPIVATIDMQGSACEDFQTDDILQCAESCLAYNKAYQEHLSTVLRHVKSALAAVRAAKDDIHADRSDTRPPGSASVRRTNAATRTSARAMGEGPQSDVTACLHPVVVPFHRSRRKHTGYFTSMQGDTPPLNTDARRFAKRKRELASVYSSTKWDPAERKELVRQVEEIVLEQKRTSILRNAQMSRAEKAAALDRVSKEPITPSDIPPMADIDWHRVAGNMANRRSADVPESNGEAPGTSSGARVRCGSTVRTAFDCRIQYEHWDHPSIDDGPWTKQEELVLLTLDKTGKPTDPVTAADQVDGRDWEKIARTIGGDRPKVRTAVQCLSHYQRCLNIKLLNSKWSKDEDAKLLAAVAKYGAHDWRGPICQELPNRTADQIIQRYRRIGQTRERKTGRWTSAEDAMLQRAVDTWRTHGAKIPWRKVAIEVPGRTDAQCRERWVRRIDPEVRKGQWSADEVETLQTGVSKYGFKWSDVTKYLRLSGYVRSDSDVMRKYKGLHPAAKEQGKARTLVAQKKLAQISKKATQPVIESTDIAALWNINTTASNASSTARESNTNIAGSTSLPTCVPTPATTDNASENDAIGDPSTAVQKRRSTRPGAGRSGEGSSRRRKKRPRTAVATTVAGDSTSGCAPMGTRVHDSAIVPAEMDLPVPTDARIPTPAEQQEALRIFNNTAVTPNPAITTAATSTQM